jgi:nitrogen fixation protein
MAVNGWRLMVNGKPMEARLPRFLVNEVYAGQL